MLNPGKTGHAGYRKPPRLRGVGYFLRCKLQHRPILLNIEFTKMCNAKCFFCHCWQVESPNESQDYGPIVKKFRPILCSVSGGEPLLRKNYAELLAGNLNHRRFPQLFKKPLLVFVSTHGFSWL